MERTLPLTKDLVLLGGGHAHALVLKSWGMRPLAGVRVTLIDPTPSAAYTGMLPGFVAGHFNRPDLEIDLVRLARFAGARFINARATAIDPSTRRITLEGRPDIHYDVAALNIGAQADIPDLDGTQHLVPVRPLSAFAQRWDNWTKDHPMGSPIAILGAGVGGIELALSMAHRSPTSTITLIDPATPARDLPSRARRRLLAALERAGITIEKSRATTLSKDSVTLESGRKISSTFTVATAGVRARNWPEASGLETHNGFICVDEQLRVTGHDTLFAAGDCAHLVNDPRPKAGVYAVRQAPILLNNFRAALGAGTPSAFRPQRDFLRLISLGSKNALAVRSGLSAAHPKFWDLKTRIDLKFMDRLSNFPDMRTPSAPREQASGVAQLLAGPAICGGCGAKVGSDILGSALKTLSLSDRDDVRSLPGDDAAMLSIGGQNQVITTDHLRAFSNDPALVAGTAATHALGDIDAMGAAAQAALATIILPPLSPALQRRTLDEIMGAANAVFSPRNVAIVGGHTTEGAELTIGFTITGLVDTPITLAGAQPGDMLILTKPIGSGTILAGEMALKATASDVVRLWKSLGQSQAEAAAILAGAHAMTDVTGFGLAGHLLNICNASGVGAVLNMNDVPLFEGAQSLAKQGIRSSLFEPNKSAAAPRMLGLNDTPRDALLFDPQTAGGLLATVHPDDATRTLNALTAAGYTAAIIGQIISGPPGITLAK